MASRLSLAARLYSIFALFALLTAAIAVLSDYNSRSSAELTQSIETANLAALNVDRARRREKIQRRAARLQRPHPGRGREVARHRAGRRCRAVRDLQETHRAVHRLPQETGAPR